MGSTTNNRLMRSEDTKKTGNNKIVDISSHGNNKVVDIAEHRKSETRFNTESHQLPQKPSKVSLQKVKNSSEKSETILQKVDLSITTHRAVQSCSETSWKTTASARPIGW